MRRKMKPPSRRLLEVALRVLTQWNNGANIDPGDVAELKRHAPAEDVNRNVDELARNMVCRIIGRPDAKARAAAG